MKRLEQLLTGIDVLAVRGSMDRNVSGICTDSRKIKTDNCFVAIEGFNQTGLEFVGDAVKGGASVIVSEKYLPAEYPDVTLIQVKNARQVSGKLAAAYFDSSAWKMYAIGVTGTNGKTTIMSLIEAIYSQAYQTAAIGTLGMACGSYTTSSSLTTP